jgi:hypothetical protein
VVNFIIDIFGQQITTSMLFDPGEEKDKDKEKKGRFSCNESIPLNLSGVRSAIARGWKGLKRNQEPECKAKRD